MLAREHLGQSAGADGRGTVGPLRDGGRALRLLPSRGRPRAVGGPWAGIARLEMPSGSGRAAAVEAAGRAAGWLPGLASALHRDARAPLVWRRGCSPTARTTPGGHGPPSACRSPLSWPLLLPDDYTRRRRAEGIYLMGFVVGPGAMTGSLAPPSSSARRRPGAASGTPPSARHAAGRTPGRSAASTPGSTADRFRGRVVGLLPRSPSSTSRSGRRRASRRRWPRRAPLPTKSRRAASS